MIEATVRYEPSASAACVPETTSLDIQCDNT